MPSGVAVVDAFKNLIRHGKNHQNVVKASPDYSDSSSSTAHSSSSRTHNQSRVPKETPQPAQMPQPVQPSPDYTREAELIVQEEREAKNKMPVYKGLEAYKILEKMGDGAFSNVYKAVETATGKKVAIKVVRKYELNASQASAISLAAGDKHLNPQFKKKPRVTERANILKEVQIMRGLNHPSIVKLLQFSESNDYYYLVLELCEGGELFHQIVKLTYFSENLARHVILQVAHGIRYLHEERGVVHRDIKPENLLFDRIPIIPSKNPVQRPYDEEKEDEGEFIPGVGGGGIGRVKIADFGLSKIVWDEQTMTPCGTVGYTAPEIVKDERYSKSVDMWALGCVLYTLLCGFPPFYDESINVLTEKVARGYYTFLSPWWDDISQSAKDLITHLLCVDPAQRFTIDEFLAHPWCNAAPAPPPPPTPAAVPMDSPLLRDIYMKGAKEARSPGLATLKEAFDITYAVHRMEEEGARRKAYGAGGRGFLGGLNEDDEEEDETLVEEARKRKGEPKVQTQTQGHSKSASESSTKSRGRSTDTGRRDERHLHEGRAGQRDRGGRGREVAPFELDMDGATLLGRRHKKGGIGGAPMESSPLARAPIRAGNNTIDTPQSPMHIA
ncbi:Pkinase-domain-containing protein [Punctularia strigosozonata HHB-11173 SS5]|uniref:Pkinase-domain-containing protein n=1 Tax=Punctularia strigosozonata (strain HHB-11173) TaxID=741275 RepID=UPI0004418178|nr:Pkinase-domain-containing protein [Punctularia strigosozonata HHB-11173 SS5]EIN10605.1 Pkinase-domain-containing protein [Punctularia strigosozonata HHB-11173 SS5]